MRGILASMKKKEVKLETEKPKPKLEKVVKDDDNNPEFKDTEKD